MLVLNINEKERKFKFGIGFLRKISESKTAIDELGIRVNVGLAYAIGNLYEKDVLTLVEVLKSAEISEVGKITDSELCEFLENENTDIEDIFSRVLSEMGESNATKATMKKISEQLALQEQ